MDYTEIFKIIKELAMQYGLWQTVFALASAASLPVLVWKLPDIIRAIKGK